jgi:protein-S-isoprenylcysteine O-methyltransferase Ste14
VRVGAVTARLPHPGVRFPPPLLYAVAFLAGYLLHRAYPLAIVADGSLALEIAGAICVGVWALFMGAAFASFLRARTNILPNRPAVTLVTTGPYRFTRNPMYVSLVLLYVGGALLLDTWWPLFFLPLVIVAIDRLVIAREERYLLDAFGGHYDAYCRRVRRWI